jgi:hypothetical protein
MSRKPHSFRHDTKGPEVYRKYAESLLKDPVLGGAPVTHDLLEILRMRLTEKEAEFCLNLTHGVEGADQIAKRMGRDIKEVSEKLDELSAKRNLLSFDREGTRRYSLLPEFDVYPRPA